MAENLPGEQRDKPQDIDARIGEESRRLLAEMDALIERARVLIQDRRKLVAILEDYRKSRRVLLVFLWFS